MYPCLSLYPHCYSAVVADEPLQWAPVVGGRTVGAVVGPVFYRWESCYCRVGIGSFEDLRAHLSFADCCRNWGILPRVHSSTQGHERQVYLDYLYHRKGEMGYRHLEGEDQSLRRSQILGREVHKVGRREWKAWQNTTVDGIPRY